MVTHVVPLAFLLRAGSPLHLALMACLCLLGIALPSAAWAAQTINATSTTSCIAQGGTLVGGNLLTDFDNGTFGFENGQPDQSPSTNPYVGQIDSGQFANFYDFFHGAFGFIANAQTARNGAQHPGITDPVYGATGRFFASDPNVTSPTINFSAQNVVPNANYQVSFWAANSEPNGAPNDINLEIDGITSLNTGQLLAFPSALEWKLYSYVFNAGNRTDVIFALRSLETGPRGRDFYIDNVELQRCNGQNGVIEGSVYSDVDGDNIFQPAREATFNNITVQLYDDRGTAATADDLFVSSTSTLTDGMFRFINMFPSNNYRLRVIENDPDLPVSATFGTPQNLLAVLASGATVSNRNFGFDLPPPNFSVTKASQVYAGQGGGVFHIPGQDVEYGLTVTNSGGSGYDANSNLMIDALPSSLIFYNGDFDGSGTLTSDPIYFVQNGAGLSFDYTNDVRFSDAATAPTGFADCNYAPAPGYDPDVRFICVNPKGTMSSGSAPPSWTIRFRAQIN